MRLDSIVMTDNLATVLEREIDSALEPSGYLGAADAFITAALDAHEKLEDRHG